jgi:2-dehydro-3-deoxyphosphogluconate aldolase / (4S)-4-hydroxy-2-oxoglutarate aldolase
MALTEKLPSLQVMLDAPVIPVIVLNDVAHAVPMARALVAGGIRMLEITLRTSVALECMRAIANEVPEAVVGAGTIRNVADAKAALVAGARFGVSPGYTSSIGKACQDIGLPLLPGVATGSEIMTAQEDGYTELKFFPAMQAGGPNLLKAWAGPFADIKFCPTGGVSLENAPQLLALPNVVVVGGSWLTPNDLMAKGEWAKMTAMAKEACALSR